MERSNPEDELRRIVAADPRYPVDAYVFVQEALDHTQRALGRYKPSERQAGGKDTNDRHVGGKELLEGIRLYALKTFGPMVPTMFDEWNIHSCEDFGEIVFNMIEYKVAKKTESDSREDFKGGYDFDDAFRKPFLPTKPARPQPPAEQIQPGRAAKS